MVIRLWSHESTRVFLDRLTDNRDRIWFTKLLETVIKYCFCGDSLSSTRQSGVTQSYGESLMLFCTDYSSLGGRRVRSTRGGGIQGPVPSDGPGLEELLKTGVRVDILQTLIPREDLTDRQLLTVDQVTMKGEDLTGELITYCCIMLLY